MAFFSFSSAESGAGVTGGAGSATQITLTPTKSYIEYRIPFFGLGADALGLSVALAAVTGGLDAGGCPGTRFGAVGCFILPAPPLSRCIIADRAPVDPGGL